MSVDPRIDRIITEVLAESAPRPSSPVQDAEKRRIAGMIDHTILKPEATEEDIRILCAEAQTYQFAAVCINPCWVPLCYNVIQDKAVKIATVVGFPLGAEQAEIKAAQTARAIQDGADEIDMVMNIGFMKSGQDELVEEDIRLVVKAAGRIPVKVIIETCLLTDVEKINACLMSKRAGAAYVKTSTGFNQAGANVGDVALMRRVVGPEIGVKAAGGIRTLEQARQMIEAGATRLGTSSSIKIVS